MPTLKASFRKEAFAICFNFSSSKEDRNSRTCAGFMDVKAHSPTSKQLSVGAAVEFFVVFAEVCFCGLGPAVVSSSRQSLSVSLYASSAASTVVYLPLKYVQTRPRTLLSEEERKPLKK